MLRRLLFCVYLCGMPLLGIAQNDTSNNGDEEPLFKAENFGFNAIDLRQNRFFYGDSEEYVNKRFYDHLNIGIVWHYERMDERVPQGYDDALSYGLFVEKELCKAQALRLSFNKGPYLRSGRPIRMNKYQMALQHSFSWTRYFGGYNPYRRFEAVTNVGVGAFYCEQASAVRVGPMFVVGAGARVQLSPFVSLGIDPYVSFVNDSIDYSGGTRHRKYNILYGADVSLAYTFHQKDGNPNKKWRQVYGGNTFVDFGLGVQFEPYSKSQLQSNALPLFSTSGPQLKLGIGYWISPGIALRATANLSSSNWNNKHIVANELTNHQAYDIRLKNVLANGRLDLLFSPYRLLTDSKEDDNLIDFCVLAGWEWGWMIKTAYDPIDLLKTYYDGPSMGLQLRCKYDGGKSKDSYNTLYIEPRLTLANYSIPYAPPYENYAKRYRDYLLSLAVGLEFVADDGRVKNRNDQSTTFSPKYSLLVQGGPSEMFVTKEYAGDFYMDYSVGVAGEAQFTPYSGTRVMAEYSRLSNRDIYNYQQYMLVDKTIMLSDTALCTGKYGFANFSVDYVFDLGTLLQGYNESHRWDVELAVGLVYSQRVRERTIISKHEMLWEFRGDTPIATAPLIDHSRVANRSFGLQLGIPVSLRVNSHWKVFFEPRARFFPRDYVQRVHFRGLTKILSSQFGVKYTF